MHEAVLNIPREYFAAYPNLDNLVILKQEVLYDHRARIPDCRAIYEQSIRSIKEYPYEKLRRGSELLNGPLMLEYCLRRLTECETPPDLSIDSVLEMLESLTGVNMPWLEETERRRTPLRIQSTSHRLRQRALAACAWTYFSAHFSLPHSDTFYAMANSEVVQKAAFCANLCAEQGLQPPIVLRITTWFASLRQRYGVDIQKSEALSGMTTALWKADAGRQQREVKNAVDRYFKRNATSNDVYTCAAAGCHVQTAHKSAFRACGGTCPAEKKPSYCSRRCQRKHWYVHRDVCRGHRTEDIITVANDDDSSCWVDSESVAEAYQTDLSRAETILRTSEIWEPQPGTEIFVDFLHPSPTRRKEFIRIRTRTLSPAFLRFVKWFYEKILPRTMCTHVSEVNERNAKARRRLRVKFRSVKTGSNVTRVEWKPRQRSKSRKPRGQPQDLCRGSTPSC
ncbi:hypothetical protein L226DRAFT_572525 [Lentinus tigrinus ALCF2SS1-7]|uniref:MYND-type domain-containing protein n=1 Tax=Lentinus tigrinus ALCF2SS1-6 TaxID=1328759 RepID=A0A5C2S1F8_9APHY|nr:hypothetical protein L227DRAFT_655672 [Lentinus tigrinus ALCF2SS1-6]RPD73077.1 hypothetical protein L226DRAFT_572525 [Lentinus tigrinus ALCF2SS1-7]